MTDIRDRLNQANNAAYQKHGVSLDAQSLQAFERAVVENQSSIAAGDHSGAVALMLANLQAEIPPSSRQTAIAVLTTMKEALGGDAPARPTMRGLTTAPPSSGGMPALFESLLAAYAGGPRPSADTVPFAGDAGPQFHPALEQASAYAQSLGYAGVRHEGTGVRMRGLGKPPVDAIELQAIKLVQKDGTEVELGRVLPEKDHLRTLKTTGALLKEMKGLIDAHHAGGAGSGAGVQQPPARPLPTGAGSIRHAVDATPASIRRIYAVSVDAAQMKLTIDPAPQPVMRGATRGARSVGVVSTITQNGGRALALQAKDAGGAWAPAAFAKGAWQSTTFKDAIEQSIRAHHPDAGPTELRGLIDDATSRLAQAGYGLDVPRDVLVVTAQGDDSPIYLAMSKDPARPGCVSICSEVTVMDFADGSPPMLTVRKPVVYFYPTKTTDLRVCVKLADEFAAQYPQANDGEGVWRLTATPDGVLFDKKTERRFSYLFWEGRARDFVLDEAQAHCVPAADAASFLERAADAYQLSDKERTDFVTYWLPALEKNRFNVVQLLDADAYGRYAQMTIEPTPDTVIRLFMIFRGSDVRVATGSPALPTHVRRGFAVIEWGGVDLDERG